ncbi:MAG: HAD family hydrolase [Actinobacteria bacterium]|nr:HAD family hydrolase [Actinomycetota bacterium]
MVLIYRLIVTDVDGTLLDSKSSIPDLNKKALMECKKKGIGIILATGKTIHSVLRHINELDLELPQVTLNGSVTVDRKLNLIDSVKIDPGVYMRVIRAIKEGGYPPVVALIDGILYIEKYYPDLRYLENVGEKFVPAASLETGYFAENAADIFIPIEESNPLDARLREAFSGELQFIRSGAFYFDILDKSATKGNAVMKIIKTLGIRREEVVVFGDSPNDLSMFEVAGLKIAVRNSYPDVIEKADIVTLENDCSGLGEAIFKYILG